MIQEGIINNRHVIARLAAPINALHRGELNSMKPKDKNVDNHANLVKNQVSWVQEKNIFTAIEFISSAFLHGDLSKAQDAYIFLKSELNTHTDIPALVRNLLVDERVMLFPELGDAGREVNRLRKILIRYPWNSIRWVELAWHHLLLGNRKKAEKALLTAYRICPDNRYIIRSLSRFYIHTDDYDKALFYASRSDIVKSDPWVLSNQIAVSNICKRTSKYVKTGISFLDNTSFHPGSLSELASELGTMDYFSGHAKKGKLKFHQSCIEPHENAMAQIAWVNKKMGLVGNHELAYAHADNDYEAQIYTKVAKNPDWMSVFNVTTKWAAYQPFSRPPIYLGSTIASSILEDYPAAIQLLNAGYEINNKDNTLINNLVYTYALMGKEHEARGKLRLINNKKMTDAEKICLTATKGLVEYRFGEVEKGRFLYSEAMRLAKMKSKRLYYNALAHLANEERRIGRNINSIVDELQKGEDYTKAGLVSAYIQKKNLYDNVINV
jgi:tetratricopeptide (TPR) repeat protein